MRDSHICPKCHHDHVLLIDRIPDTGEFRSHIRSLHVTGHLVREPGFISPAVVEFAGRLCAAVCKRCGFTELYAANPEAIPVDGERVREVVGTEPTPYR